MGRRDYRSSIPKHAVEVIGRKLLVGGHARLPLEYLAWPLSPPWLGYLCVQVILEKRRLMNDSYNSRPATLRIPDPSRGPALVSDT